MLFFDRTKFFCYQINMDITLFHSFNYFCFHLSQKR